MIRKLTVLTVFSVSALFFAKVLIADQATLPDGALLQAKANDKLLIPRVITRPQTAFEQGMADAGWDVHVPSNLAFYNVRNIIARNDLAELQSEINQKLNSAYRASRAVNSSA